LNHQNLEIALALSRVQGIGRQTLKYLLEEFTELSELFSDKAADISARTGFKPQWVDKIRAEADFAFAKKELAFCRDEDIQVILYGSSAYPFRLSQCSDAPAFFFAKGLLPFQAKKWLAVVGTRKATPYGKDWCKKMLEEIADLNPVIVSGLALGIDICAHKAALELNLPTVGVLGHGLDTVYPSNHRQVAVKMLDKGGLIAEYPHGTIPDASNFPERNRIIAGLCDGIIVVEGAESGGALITADIAFSYSREVMALPGRADDTWSRGCNALIKYNKASLVENAADICRVMGWKIKAEGRKSFTPELFPMLEPGEDRLFNVLREKGPLHVDELVLLSGQTQGETAINLLNLELKGLIGNLPGKMYKAKS
jgi:DNA processing protein